MKVIIFLLLFLPICMFGQLEKDTSSLRHYKLIIDEGPPGFWHLFCETPYSIVYRKLNIELVYTGCTSRISRDTLEKLNEKTIDYLRLLFGLDWEAKIDSKVEKERALYDSINIVVSELNCVKKVNRKTSKPVVCLVTRRTNNENYDFAVIQKDEKNLRLVRLFTLTYNISTHRITISNKTSKTVHNEMDL